ncbi:MAG: hypothetical protein AB7V53_07170, partial [Dongiaceae bacterium]
MRKTQFIAAARPSRAANPGRTALLLGRASLVALAAALTPVSFSGSGLLPDFAPAWAQSTDDDGTADQGPGDALGTETGDDGTDDQGRDDDNEDGDDVNEDGED